MGDIRVRNGDRVQAGEIVMSFDGQLLRSNRALIDDQLIASEARLARLVAEHDGLDGLALSDELADRFDEPKVEYALSSQRLAMAAKRAAREGQVTTLQVEKSFREQVANEISMLAPEITQLKDRRAAVDLILARVLVRAPADGYVHELSVHTIGGVVQPGATLMQIVPEADNLLVSATIAPKDVNHVTVGQKAPLVIGAFDQKTMPKFDAHVTYVSADLKTDAASGMGYYEVRAELDEEALTQLSQRDLALLPGMPSEVYIETGHRTAAEYLLEPLTKQLRTTFRET